MDRTPDLMIFSHTLSQLSYLGFWSCPLDRHLDLWKSFNFIKESESLIKMRNSRTSKIDGLVDIYRNPQDGFDPEPTTIPFVSV